MKPQQGFSLIELMIVLVIIGILTAIALPSYSSYRITSNRTALKGDLSQLAALLERRYTENGFYTTTRISSLCIPLTAAPYFSQAPSSSTTKVYTIAFQGACTSTTYTLRATPIAGTIQASDGYLELSATGAKTWDKNNNGAINAGENDW